MNKYILLMLLFCNGACASELDYQKAFCNPNFVGQIITNYGTGTTNQYKLKSGKIIDCVTESGNSIEIGFANKTWLTDIAQSMYYAAAASAELHRQFSAVVWSIVETDKDCSDLSLAYFERRTYHLPVTITEIGPYAYQCNIDRWL